MTRGVLVKSPSLSPVLSVTILFTFLTTAAIGQRQQAFDECSAGRLQLITMVQRKLAQSLLALRRQPDSHLSLVRSVGRAEHKSSLHQPVQQSTHAVMPQLKPFCEIGDRGPLRARISTYRQEQLVLPRFETGGDSGPLAESQKSPNLVTEFR